MKSLLRPALRAGVLACCLLTPWAASAQDADRALGPIRLVRPLSPHTIEILYKEADSAYRGERWTAAMQGFRVLIGYEPGHGRSWFRIGNLHQQRRQYVAAAGAYRRAAAAIDPTAPDVPAGDAVVRNKALLNLALVNAELARDALSQFEPSSDEEAGMLNEVRANVGEVHDESQRRARMPLPTHGPRDWADSGVNPWGERAGAQRRSSAPGTQTAYPEPDQVRSRPVARAVPHNNVPGRARSDPGAAASGAPIDARPEGPSNATAWSRRSTVMPQPPVESRSSGPAFVPASGTSDRPLLRTAVERNWTDRSDRSDRYDRSDRSDRYDDEPEVRPQIEYLRGVPRQ